MSTKDIKGYKIDFSTNTLILNYKFHNASQQYGSPEYKLVNSILSDLPNLTIIVQAGRTVTSANKNKRLTYENMKKHISAYENSEELLAVFESVKAMSKPLASPHKYVADWFKAQFPDYNATPVYKNKKLIVLPLLPTAPNPNVYKLKSSDAEAVEGIVDELPPASGQ